MIPLLLLLATLSIDLDRIDSALQEGQYEEAIRLGGQVERPGGALLYDLGNCAFRLGRYAEAALYYRRSLLRSPRDQQTRFNLLLAEQRLGLVLPVEESFAASMKGALHSFTPEETLVLTVVFQLLCLAGLALFRSKKTVPILLVLLLVVSLAGSARVVQQRWFPGSCEGVVTARKIAVRPDPLASAPVLFEVRAGETVEVTEFSDRWMRVLCEKGSGWTERPGVGLVD